MNWFNVDGTWWVNLALYQNILFIQYEDGTSHIQFDKDRAHLNKEKTDELLRKLTNELK